ncbi:hypothetical protein LINPERPRIM_LOCUS6239 [Linum perenne]
MVVVTLSIFTCFGWFLRRNENFTLNSLACVNDFKKEIVYKPIGTILMQYAKLVVLNRIRIDIKDFHWRMPFISMQPDIENCGLFVARYMENYFGKFNLDPNQQWNDIDVMETLRLNYMCHLVLDKLNKSRDYDMVSAVLKYDAICSQTYCMDGMTPLY